jgi:cytidine deaminase
LQGIQINGVSFRALLLREESAPAGDGACDSFCRQKKLQQSRFLGLTHDSSKIDTAAWFGFGMTRGKGRSNVENGSSASKEEVRAMPLAQLSSHERELLLDAARKALKRAYAPYSKFHVGAAVLTEQGEVFTGCNVENASYGLTNCAERSAIFSAVQSTKGTKLAIRAVAVVNGDELPCSPCGACRQVIFEFGENAIVIFKGQQGYLEMPIQDLLPESFRLS